jgi:sugar/nucleoside kinase (ribokinase family)
MNRIAVLGDINIDYIIQCRIFPKLGSDVEVDELLVRVGGSAVNTSIVLASEGFHTYLLTAIGNDPEGRKALSIISTAGVDVKYVKEVAGPTGRVFSIEVQGERTMFSFRGVNNYYKLTHHEINEIIKNIEWLHISGYSLINEPQLKTALKIMHIAISKGVLVSFDPGPLSIRIENPIRKEVLSNITVYTGGLSETYDFIDCHDLEECIELLRRSGINEIVLKMGSKGVKIICDGKTAEVRPPKLYQRFITGAGDAFNAGYIAARLRGLDCVEAGSLGLAKALEWIESGGLIKKLL